jgi:hypothetical protein
MDPESMGSAGFTLADRLGVKSLPCSVSGCTRTWISMAGAGNPKNGKSLKLGGRGAADPNDPSSSMCDPCRDKLANTRDVDRPCDRPGCTGTWVWPVDAQLVAFATKRPAPQGMCAACEQKLASLEDRPVPCRVEGCTRSSVFARRAQLLLGAPDVELTPPASMCPQCDGVYQKLKDRQVGCGIAGCKHKWTWSRDEQIQAYAAGLNNEPPRRMCDECKGAFGSIADREVRCRASGCKKTWTWSRSDQLDACLAGKPPPKAPHRMCGSCIDIYQKLKDVDRPCRRAGCKGTWLDKRGAQLARAVRGKTGDPYPQYCESCEKELGDLEDRQVPCKTDNCTGTWTWAKAAQLAAGVRPEPKHEELDDQDTGKSAEQAAPGPDVSAGANASASAEGSALSPEAGPVIAAAPAPDKRRRRNNKRRREIRPPERRCQTCLEFLADRKTIEISCQGCHTPIYWPPESQLQTHLGAWSAPALCGACKRDLTEAQRAAQREALRHPHLPGAEAPAASAEPTAVATADAVVAAPPEPAPAESEPAPEASS